MEFSYFLSEMILVTWFFFHQLRDGMPKLMGWLTLYHYYYISDEISDVITITIAD